MNDNDGIMWDNGTTDRTIPRSRSWRAGSTGDLPRMELGMTHAIRITALVATTLAIAWLAEARCPRCGRGTVTQARHPDCRGVWPHWLTCHTFAADVCRRCERALAAEGDA